MTVEFCQNQNSKLDLFDLFVNTYQLCVNRVSTLYSLLSQFISLINSVADMLCPNSQSWEKLQKCCYQIWGTQYVHVCVYIC